MLILAVEASTKIASVALQKNNTLIEEFFSDNPKSHSEILNNAIQNILDKNNIDLSEIDLFAADTGPGSFTGVRVACNIVRSFGYLFHKQIFSASSLEILAHQTCTINQKNIICMINAYRNMLFLSAHKNDDMVFGPEAIPVAEFQNILNKIKSNYFQKSDSFYCIGDGYKAYNSILMKFSELIYDEGLEIHHPKASSLASLAYESFHNKNASIQTKEWKSIIPLYLRASAAEENFRN